MHPQERRLLIDGLDCPLGAKAFDLLLALLDSGGALASKRALMDKVWPGLVVGENNLPVQIAHLRRMLGQAAIATVPGRGYRFCLPVQAEPAAAPPQASRASSPPPPLEWAGSGNSLPLPLTPFFGFETERSDCAALLLRSRLLTLTGMGGAGKTRLAIEVARAVEDRFKDGVSFIDLAPVHEPLQLAQALASAVGLREAPALTVEAALVQRLAGQQRLLVLDNCEHLLGACAAWVERLLARLPLLRVLATSRESLGVAGEWVVAMRSMQVPLAGADADTYADVALHGCESVDLFVSLARQALPGFELNAGNAAAVAEVCRRLDGIPLALELAAARVKLMTIEQIRNKLDDRFRLLTETGKSHSRHRTLLAVLQWSHEHLSPAEQQLLQRLSVFAGGWTVAAALAIDGGGDEWLVADLLRQLVDRSLVAVERHGEDEARYSLLETVRHFARDRLLDAGLAELTQDRHLAYFLQFAQAQGQALSGPGVKRAADALDAERANLLAAQAWCDRATDGIAQGLDLANALRRYWIVTGLYVLGQQCFRDALARLLTHFPSRALAMALFGLGQLCNFRGQLDDASRLAEQAVALCRVLDEPALLIVCLDLDRAVRLRLCQGVRARLSADEAVAVAHRLADPYFMAIAQLGLGAQQREDGNYPLALHAFSKSRDLFESIGNLANLPHPARNLAALYFMTGLPEQARESLALAFRSSHFVGPNNRAELNIAAAVRLAAMSGNWPLAARIQGALERYLQVIGASEPPAEPYLASWADKPRQMLGAATYALHHEAGAALSLADTTAEIMVWLTGPVLKIDPQSAALIAPGVPILE